MQNEIIIRLIENERRKADEKYEKFFHTLHEGESVLREEIQETNEEQQAIWMLYKDLWQGVRADNEMYIMEMASKIYYKAQNLVREAAQVAAMAEKFEDSIAHIRGYE